MPESLSSRRIAVAETRELDLFSDMLAREGAEVIRCPLVAILDTPDKDKVEAWLHRVIAGGAHDIVLYTGEGLRRLLGFAERAGLKADFVAALGQARKITRGPKPVRALREVGLEADITAVSPTTDGLIASLDAIDLRGRSVAVQLYGQEPNLALDAFLRGKGAQVDPVAPYIYASAAEEGRVLSLIEEMAAGKISAIAFTSSPQVARIFDVAERAGRVEQLATAFACCKVVAMGPIVVEELRRRHVTPDSVAAPPYTLKPMLKALIGVFAHAAAGSAGRT